VVEGRYRLTHVPERIVPLEDWLRPQARFAHLFAGENRELLTEIERRVRREWSDLLDKCDERSVS
jgi:pyruvate ferredoxin oxidoreductase beta subunit